MDWSQVDTDLQTPLLVSGWSFGVVEQIQQDTVNLNPTFSQHGKTSKSLNISNIVSALDILLTSGGGHFGFTTLRLDLEEEQQLSVPTLKPIRS